MSRNATFLLGFVSLLAVVLVGCQTTPTPGTKVKRHGDEIMVAGQLFRIGTPVVLWTDPDGYDAYRVEKRFADFEQSHWDAIKDEIGSPNRYGMRISRFNNGMPDFTPEQIEQVRGGWTLEQLRDVVDQFVVHYDVCGTSRQCFKVLHDMRCLSVHFMLDLDGTIYQTLDLKERAWHAGTANSRSVGIEIANMGAYGENESKPWDDWYGLNDKGETIITIPDRLGDGGIRTPHFVGKPVRRDPVYGEIQGRMLEQYDLTPQQYDALIKLTAALHRIFPKIELRYPTDVNGELITHELTPEQFAEFRGVIGHYHITDRKVDPGPAFQWDTVIDGARRELSPLR